MLFKMGLFGVAHVGAYTFYSLFDVCLTAQKLDIIMDQSMFIYREQHCYFCQYIFKISNSRYIDIS